MKTLNVLSFPSFTYKAAIRGYTSAVVERAWNGIGRLTLVVSADIPNAATIARDDVLLFDREYHKAYIVEKVEEEMVAGVVTLTVTAPGIETLLADYVTVPPDGDSHDVRTGTREQVARSWVDANVVNPVEGSRKQYPIVLGEYQGLGDLITDQTRYAKLSDELSRILAPQDLGYRLRLEFDAGTGYLVFEVVQGVDRTTDAEPVSVTVVRRDDDGVDFAEGALDRVAVSGVSLVLAKDETWDIWAGLTWQEVE